MPFMACTADLLLSFTYLGSSSLASAVLLADVSLGGSLT